MDIVAIIQARMGSTRLPGKVLKEIGNKTMLGHVVTRTQQAEMIDQIVVATTTKPDDEAIVSTASELGVPAFRGSEPDVLDRYYRAAKQYEVGTVVRITADCPLTDPDVTDRALRTFKKQKPDYASTHLKRRTYPRGVGAEVMTFEALKEAWEKADESYEREHVTPYIYQHPDQFQLYHISSSHGDYSHLRFTVDTSHDLAFVRGVHNRLDNEFASWVEVIDLLEKNPNMIKINQHVEQKKLRE